MFYFTEVLLYFFFLQTYIQIVCCKSTKQNDVLFIKTMFNKTSDIMVIITLTVGKVMRKQLTNKANNKRLFQSLTSTSALPGSFVGKRDACSATKSALFGFGVGAILAGMLTGGWMWKAGSSSLSFLSSRH